MNSIPFTNRWTNRTNETRVRIVLEVFTEYR